jgi:signal peptidase I
MNLNTILLLIAVGLTIVEAIIHWGFPKIRQHTAGRIVLEYVDAFWIALLVALTIKTLFIQAYKIPSGSMEPTLLPGDYILVKKYEYGYSLFNETPRFLEFNKPKRGDVIVFVYPRNHSKDYIKRVEGVPGDVLMMKNKILYVNGKRQYEPYVIHTDPNIIPRKNDLGWERDNWGPVTVRPNHYFMMGDNRDDSSDSRVWGQLNAKYIKGQAWIIYWHSNNFHPDFSRMFKLIPQ